MLAAGFRRIAPETVQRRALMQETFLRGSGNQRRWMGQGNGLAQLSIPVAEAQRDPLEGGHCEIVAHQTLADSGRVVIVDDGRGLSNGAGCDPELIVERAHPTIRQPDEAILELDGAPGLDCRMPGCRAEALGSCGGPRIPSAIEDQIAELAQLICDHGDVVVDPLSEYRHFRLRLTPCIRAEIPHSLIHYANTELFGRTSQGIGVELVARAGTFDQEP